MNLGPTLIYRHAKHFQPTAVPWRVPTAAGPGQLGVGVRCVRAGGGADPAARREPAADLGEPLRRRGGVRPPRRRRGQECLCVGVLASFCSRHDSLRVSSTSCARQLTMLQCCWIRSGLVPRCRRAEVGLPRYDAAELLGGGGPCAHGGLFVPGLVVSQRRAVWPLVVPW